MTAPVSPRELKLAVISIVALVLVNMVVSMAVGVPFTQAAGFQDSGAAPSSPDAVPMTDLNDSDIAAPQNVSADSSDFEKGETSFLEDTLSALGAVLSFLLPDGAEAALNMMVNGVTDIVGWIQATLNGWGTIADLAGWAAPLVIIPQFILMVLVVNPIVKVVAALSPL